MLMVTIHDTHTHTHTHLYGNEVITKQNILIARQQAMHAECYIVLSVALWYCISKRMHISLTCLTWQRHSLVSMSATAVTKVQGNSLSGGH